MLKPLAGNIFERMYVFYCVFADSAVGNFVSIMLVKTGFGRN